MRDVCFRAILIGRDALALGGRQDAEKTQQPGPLLWLCVGWDEHTPSLDPAASRPARRSKRGCEKRSMGPSKGLWTVDRVATRPRGSQGGESTLKRSSSSAS